MSRRNPSSHAAFMHNKCSSWKRRYKHAKREYERMIRNSGDDSRKLHLAVIRLCKFSFGGPRGPKIERHSRALWERLRRKSERKPNHLKRKPYDEAISHGLKQGDMVRVIPMYEPYCDGVKGEFVIKCVREGYQVGLDWYHGIVVVRADDGRAVPIGGVEKVEIIDGVKTYVQLVWDTHS